MTILLEKLQSMLALLRHAPLAPGADALALTVGAPGVPLSARGTASVGVEACGARSCSGERLSPPRRAEPVTPHSVRESGWG